MWSRRSAARRVVAALSVVGAASVASALAPTPSATAVAPAPPQFYGVATSAGLTLNDFQKLARANIRTVRLVMYWPAIQRGAGQRYEWNAFDGAVINAAYAGVGLIPTVIGSPKHISEDPFRPPLDSDFEKAEWQRFLRAAVERYGAGGGFWDEVYACNGGHCHPSLPYRPLRVWQMWSEPNLGYFWQPAPSPSEYAELLRLGEDAVHAGDPDAEVVTGGVMPGRGPNSIPQSDFLASLYSSPGITESFDGLALQPYVRKPRSVRRRVKKVRALTQAFGDGGVPLWLTEIGWSTKGPKDHYLVTTRKGQAKRLKRTYKILTRMREPYGIRAATWFSYRDGWTEPYCEWCPGAGLLKKNRKPKPAWKRYAKLAGGKP
jgi:hypothetical protein